MAIDVGSSAMFLTLLYKGYTFFKVSSTDFTTNMTVFDFIESNAMKPPQSCLVFVLNF